MKIFLLIAIVAMGFSFLIPVDIKGEIESPDNSDTVEQVPLLDAVFHVEGMDSVSIYRVQDALTELEGVYRNFACYADTIVFVEFDSAKVSVDALIEEIARIGFKAELKEDPFR